MAKTYDMLYIRRQFGTNTTKSHIIEHTAPVKRPAPAIAAGLETPLKALKNLAGETVDTGGSSGSGEIDLKAGKKAKKGKGKGKSGKKGGDPNELSPEEKKNKEIRKDS